MLISFSIKIMKLGSEQSLGKQKRSLPHHAGKGYVRIAIDGMAPLEEPYGPGRVVRGERAKLIHAAT